MDNFDINRTILENERLRKQVAELRATLQIYGDKENWCTCSFLDDERWEPQCCFIDKKIRNLDGWLYAEQVLAKTEGGQE